MPQRDALATVAQLVGATLFAVGIGLIFLPAGLIAAGVCMVVFGVALELGGDNVG